ncbi:hypothetical protein niasHT_031437 [Heterodera trifolii]|uniref:Uncharacterized protein n=1 Tax=Heterodera trifolii TaxID=157864 RepID=A0ABD2HYB2_9BILA
MPLTSSFSDLWDRAAGGSCATHLHANMAQLLGFFVWAHALFHCVTGGLAAPVILTSISALTATTIFAASRRFGRYFMRTVFFSLYCCVFGAAGTDYRMQKRVDDIEEFRIKRRRSRTINDRCQILRCQVGEHLDEVLLTRQHGQRPITLIGFSPVRFTIHFHVVTGRVINGYCKSDWLLRFLYRTNDPSNQTTNKTENGVAPGDEKNNTLFVLAIIFGPLLAVALALLCGIGIKVLVKRVIRWRRERRHVPYGPDDDAISYVSSPNVPTSAFQLELQIFSALSALKRRTPEEEDGTERDWVEDEESHGGATRGRSHGAMRGESHSGATRGESHSGPTRGESHSGPTRRESHGAMRDESHSGPMVEESRGAV